MSTERPTPTFLDPDEVEWLPTTVWIPVQLPQFGGAVPELMLRETTNGALTLPVYSSFEQLQNRHGAYEHAIEFASRELEYLRQMAGFATVALDLEVPPELRLSDREDEDAEWPEAPVEETVGEVVWTLWRPSGRGDDSRVEVELHGNDSEQRVLALYTSKETLRACAGPYQPAVAIRANEVEQVAEEAGADVVEFNPAIAPEARHQQSFWESERS